MRSGDLMPVHRPERCDRESAARPIPTPPRPRSPPPTWRLAIPTRCRAMAMAAKTHSPSRCWGCYRWAWSTLAKSTRQDVARWADARGGRTRKLAVVDLVGAALGDQTKGTREDVQDLGVNGVQ